MRPLEHLENQAVLATGYVENWQHTAEDTAVLLRWVEIFDYQTGKPAAPKLDHVWIWVTRGAWKELESWTVTSSERLLLHDPANFVGRVRRYTRTDGTQDIGLRLVNFQPLTPEQQAIARNGHRELAKRTRHVPTNKLVQVLISQDLYRREFEYQIGDWRDVSDRSLKDARSLVLQNISAIKGVLRPRMGMNQGDFEQFVSELLEEHPGAKAVTQQLEERLAA